jgi:hypothetical protein
MLPEIQAAVLRVKTEAGVALDACNSIEKAPLEPTKIVSVALTSKETCVGVADAVCIYGVEWLCTSSTQYLCSFGHP